MPFTFFGESTTNDFVVVVVTPSSRACLSSELFIDLDGGFRDSLEVERLSAIAEPSINKARRRLARSTRSTVAGATPLAGVLGTGPRLGSQSFTGVHDGSP